MPLTTNTSNQANNLEPNILLSIENLSKSFNGVEVLQNVNLKILSGEVHALLGINGSGKSTLIKILSGYHSADYGVVQTNQLRIQYPEYGTDIRAINRQPIAFVHQDLGLFNELTVNENFHLKSIVNSSTRKPIQWPAKRRQTINALEKYGVNIDPTLAVHTLSPLDRARLAIVRAYEDLERISEKKNGILVLDEPTVFLPVADRQKVWSLIRNLTASGGGVLIVSHDLLDVRAIADIVTILRDGVSVDSVAVSKTTDHQLFEMLIGESLPESTDSGRNHKLISTESNSGALANQYESENAPSTLKTSKNLGIPKLKLTTTTKQLKIPYRRQSKEPRPTGAPLLEVVDLSGRQVEQVSFSLNPGEIVGLTGPPGSGYDNIPYLLFGAIRAKGQLKIRGVQLPLNKLTPTKAIDIGLALVPADRASQGGIAALSAIENYSMLRLPNYKVHGLLSRRQMKTEFNVAANQFGISPIDGDKPFSLYSGGNQQKIIMAKWLAIKPAILLLHEPTQGVDVKAKQDLLNFMSQISLNGTAILWVSSDQEDLATVCQKVLVIRNGILYAELKQPLTNKLIIEASYG